MCVDLFDYYEAKHSGVFKFLMKTNWVISVIIFYYFAFT